MDEIGPRKLLLLLSLRCCYTIFVEPSLECASEPCVRYWYHYSYLSQQSSYQTDEYAENTVLPEDGPYAS